MLQVALPKDGGKVVLEAGEIVGMRQTVDKGRRLSLIDAGVEHQEAQAVAKHQEGDAGAQLLLEVHLLVFEEQRRLLDAQHHAAVAIEVTLQFPVKVGQHPARGRVRARVQAKGERGLLQPRADRARRIARRRRCEWLSYDADLPAGYGSAAACSKAAANAFSAQA